MNIENIIILNKLYSKVLLLYNDIINKQNNHIEVKTTTTQPTANSKSETKSELNPDTKSPAANAEHKSELKSDTKSNTKQSAAKSEPKTHYINLYDNIVKNIKIIFNDSERTYLDYINCLLLTSINNNVKLKELITNNIIGYYQEPNKYLCILGNPTTTNERESIRMILNKNSINDILEQDISNIMIEIQNECIEIFVQYAIILNNEYTNKYANIHHFITKYSNNGTKKYLLEYLVTKLSEALLRIIKKYINKQLYITDNNQNTQNLMMNVYNNWDKLVPDARAFYNEQLHLFYKLNNQLSENKSEWKDLMGDSFVDLQHMKPNKQYKYRINLMKSFIGSNHTMFEHTLPFVSINDTTQIWYTKKSGTKYSITVNSTNSDLFKKIYRCVYNDNECIINDILLELPDKYTDLPNIDFDLDDIQIINNYIQSQQILY